MDSAPPAAAIVAQGLTKTYGARGKRTAVRALKAVDLSIPTGSFFGLLGPNGAGKSTFINILAGLVKKSAGTVSVWGHDLDSDMRRARASIGVMPQELNLDPFFTAFEAVEFQAGLYGVPKPERRTAEILDMLRLTEVAQAWSRSLSGGMRRRLLLAKAMAHTPPVLVLDEPTAGVDVELRHLLWSNLKRLNGEGVTILLTTHYLEEAEKLCDRIAIIHRGQLVASETTAQMVRRIDRKEMHLKLARVPEAIPASLARLDTELRPDNTLVVRYAPSRTSVAEVLAAVQAGNLEILDLTTEQSDLEEVFLALTSG